MSIKYKNLLTDILIIVLSIILAIWMINSGVLSDFLGSIKGSLILGSFVAGVLFTSIFTAAPAVIVLSELAQRGSALEIALVGAFGSLLGDMLMFAFLKDRLARDFYALFKINTNSSYFRIPRFQWLIVLLAGVVIASPFPDELGLAMLGFSNTKKNWLVPVSFFANFVGIWAVVSIAK